MKFKNKGFCLEKERIGYFSLSFKNILVEQFNFKARERIPKILSMSIRKMDCHQTVNVPCNNNSLFKEPFLCI